MEEKKVQYEAVNFSDDEEPSVPVGVKIEGKPEQIPVDPEGLLTSLKKITDICGQINNAEKGDLGLMPENVDGPSEPPQITIDTTTYTCKLCKDSFEHQHLVEAHLVSTHDLGDQTALFTYCKAVKKPKKIWRREKDGYFHCLYCHHRSRRSINIRQHEAADHKGEKLPVKNYTCKLCKQKFALEQIFEHIESEHPDHNPESFIGNSLSEHYTVNIQSRTESIIQFDNQESQGTGGFGTDGKYHCGKCNYISAELEEFTEHVKEHGASPCTPPQRNTQFKFKYCQHCSYKTKSERGLRLHERMQHASANVKKGKTVCNACGEARTKNAIHACTKTKKKKGRKFTLVRDHEGKFLCADCDYKHKNYNTIHMHTKVKKHQIQRINPVILNTQTDTDRTDGEQCPLRTTRSLAKKTSVGMKESEGETRSSEFIIEKDIASCAMIGIDHGEEGVLMEKNIEKPEVEGEEEEKAKSQEKEDAGGGELPPEDYDSFYDSDFDDSIPEDSDDDWTPTGSVKRKSTSQDTDTDESRGEKRKRGRKPLHSDPAKKRRYTVSPKDPNSPSPKKTETGDFQCNFCDFVSKYAQSIECHQWRHTGFKPYTCNDCSHSFRAKQTMENHKCTKLDGSAGPALNKIISDTGTGNEHIYNENFMPSITDERSETQKEPLSSSKPTEHSPDNATSPSPNTEETPREDPIPSPKPTSPRELPQPREIAPTEPEGTSPAETNHVHISPLTEDQPLESAEQGLRAESHSPHLPASEEQNSSSVATAATTLGSPTPIVIQPPLSVEPTSNALNIDPCTAQGETGQSDCVVTSFTEARVRNRTSHVDSAVPMNIAPIIGFGQGLPLHGDMSGQRPFIPDLVPSTMMPRISPGRSILRMQTVQQVPQPLEAMAHTIGHVGMSVPTRPQAIQIEPLVNNNNQEQQRSNTNGFNSPENPPVPPSQQEPTSNIPNPRITSIVDQGPLLTSSPRQDTNFTNSSPVETATNASGSSTPQRTETHVSTSSSPHPSLDTHGATPGQTPPISDAVTTSSTTPVTNQSTDTQASPATPTTRTNSTRVDGEPIMLTGVTAISDVTPSSAATSQPMPVMLTPNFAALASSNGAPRPIVSTSANLVTTVAPTTPATQAPASVVSSDGKSINDLYKCLLCRVYFEDQAMHRNHMAHHGQTIGTCRVCSRMFRTPLLFMSHLHCSFQCRGVTPVYTSSRGRGGSRGGRPPAPQIVSPGSIQINSRGPRSVNPAANISLAQAMSSGMSNTPGRMASMTGNMRNPVAALASMTPRTATIGRRGRPPLNSYSPRAAMSTAAQQQMQMQQRQQQQRRPQQMQHMVQPGSQPAPPPGSQSRRRDPNPSDVIIID